MKSTRKLVYCAAFAALCCLTTYLLAFPFPGGIGYFNVGDVIVLLAGWCLGPWLGGVAAGGGSALADVMAVKYELGVKTREAYKRDDKKELLRLVKEEYSILLKRLRAFQLALEKQWYTENKPYGFDVQELRSGGVFTRTESCKRRLLDYANGKISEIPELDEELIEISPTSYLYKNNEYDFLATVSTLWGAE